MPSSPPTFPDDPADALAAVGALGGSPTASRTPPSSGQLPMDGRWPRSRRPSASRVRRCTRNTAGDSQPTGADRWPSNDSPGTPGRSWSPPVRRRRTPDTGRSRPSTCCSPSHPGRTSGTLGLDRDELADALAREEERSLAAVGIAAVDYGAPATRRRWRDPRMATSAKLALERGLAAAVERRTAASPPGTCCSACSRRSTAGSTARWGWPRSMSRSSAAGSERPAAGGRSDLLLHEPLAQRRLLELAGGRARDLVDELEAVGDLPLGVGARQDARAAARARPPGRRAATTTASGRSPQRSSGIAITAASATSGWAISRFSRSTEEIHSPPDLTRSLERSQIFRLPPSSILTTSPV